MKSRFFANISHELRTPLTLISGPINSILNSKDLGNRNFTYASIIKQNALKLEKRINEIRHVNHSQQKANLPILLCLYRHPVRCLRFLGTKKIPTA